MLAVIRWWMVIVLTTFGVFVSWYFGGVQFILNADPTGLSVATVLIFLLASISVGYKTWIAHHKGQDYGSLEYEWYAAEACLGIGMVGTVTGFVLMLTTAMSEFDPGNVEAMRATLEQMARGMGTALVTTLVGLLTSLILKFQLIIAENG